MRTAKVNEKHREEASLATKLEHEVATWRKSRPERQKFSMKGVQVIRIPKRRILNTAINGRARRS